MTELGSLLAEAMAGALSGLAVAGVGRVTAYDVTTGRATVQPGVKRRVTPTAQGGAPTFRELAPVYGVPVCWPGGGSFGAHAPLAVGDKVLLVFCDQDPSIFLRTGEVSAPVDAREHHLAHAIAIPLVLPAHAEASAMTIGHTSAPVRLTSSRIEVDGTSDAPALASKLDALIVAIKNAADGDCIPGAVSALFGAVAGGSGTGLSTTTGSTKIKTGG